jgi:hypothetical protein
MADIPMERAPMKQSEKIDKIFYAVFGMNGEDGLVKQLNKTNSKLDAYFRQFDEFKQTRGETCPINNKELADRVALKLRISNTVRYIISLAGWATLITKLIGWW